MDFIPANTAAYSSQFSGRPLKETSGNYQELPLKDTTRIQKCDGPSTSENFYRSSYSRQERQGIKFDEETNLLQQLARSEKYRKYRKRPPKKSTVPKWPDDEEESFWRALVRYPPMGRRKKLSDKPRGTNDKPRGRNELIADAIAEQTGHRRLRKQISSHIQVLKHKFKGYPSVMRYLGDDDKSCSRQRQSSSDTDVAPKIASDKSTAQIVFSQDSMQPLESSYAEAPPMVQHLKSRKQPVSQFGVESLKPLIFEMYIQGENMIPVHTITKYERGQKFPATPYNNLSESSSLFPQLHKLVTDSQRIGKAYLAESSLFLMTEHTSIPAGSALSIQLEIAADQELGAYSDIECRTEFFQNGTTVDSSTERVEYDDLYKRLPLKFKSSFWAKTISELTKSLRGAGKKYEETSADSRLEAQQIREKVKDSLRNMSAVQELYATPHGCFEEKSILLICWKFRLAEDGEPGETTWSNLILPGSACEGETEELSQYGGMQLGMRQGPVHQISQTFHDRPNFELNAPPIEFADTQPVIDDLSIPSMPNDFNFPGGPIYINIGQSTPVETYNDDHGYRLLDNFHQQHSWNNPHYSMGFGNNYFPNFQYADNSGNLKDGVVLSDFHGDLLTEIPHEII